MNDARGRRHRVFVYGTLRRGGAYASWLAGGRYLGRHVTAPVYTMYDFGDYPGVRPNGHSGIVGEVYEIDGRQLERLDEFEDYPTLYTREFIPTPFGDAWIYLLNASAGDVPVIAPGDWLRIAGLHTQPWFE